MLDCALKHGLRHLHVFQSERFGKGLVVVLACLGIIFQAAI